MTIGAMLGHLSRNWGWIVLRGVAAILFGLLAFAWPGLTLALLVLAWGIYAISDGILALIAAFGIKDEGKPMWQLLLVGLIGIGAGVYTFARPGMTALVLLSFIAIWAVAVGIFQILAAFRLRKVIANEWMLALSGAVSLVFGILMWMRPGAGALAVVWVIACFAIAFGLLLVMLGFKLKGLAGHLPKAA